MRLSKTTTYAIRILLDCASADGELVKVADISERREVTLQNTFKIVHLLSRAGFLQAVRGRHGGVRLARPAKDIRIGDVVRAMETMRLESDADADGALGAGALDQLFVNALEAFVSVLDGHTLEEMAKAKRPESKRSDEQGGAKAKSTAKEKARAPRRTASQSPRSLE